MSSEQLATRIIAEQSGVAIPYKVLEFLAHRIKWEAAPFSLLPVEITAVHSATQREALLRVPPRPGDQITAGTLVFAAGYLGIWSVFGVLLSGVQWGLHRASLLHTMSAPSSLARRAPDTVPAKYANRLFYPHNPQITLMRTTADECRQLGGIIARKANAYKAGTAIMIPKKAISVISAAGQPFHDPAADEALFQAIRTLSKIPVKEFDEEINSQVFARACAEQLLRLMNNPLT